MSEPQRESETKEHKAAMAVRALLDGLSDLVVLAHDGIGYEIVQGDIRDLELIHRDLTILLALLKQNKLRAVS